MSSKSLWKNEYYVESYILASQGMPDTDIATKLGVKRGTFEIWKKKRPSLRDALDRGRKKHEAVHSPDGDVNSFKNYVYGQLPPRLRALWEQLKELGLKKRFKKQKYLIGLETEEAQKHMFIYALCACNFNPTRACKRASISDVKFKKWMQDKDFKELLDQIEIHRNNFYEEALVKKVKEGDTSAILFVNRTKNRERGYGDKQTVEVQGTINHQHSHLIQIDDLPLSLEVKKAILQAIRDKKEKEKVKGLEYTEKKGELEYEVKNGKAIPVEEDE